MSTVRRGRVLGALVAGAAALLAGCSSSTSGSGSDDPVVTPLTSSAAAATTPVTPPPSPSVAAPSTPATSSPATRTATPTHPASRTVPPAAPRSTCTAVSIRVIRGAASPGQEIAALQFTNDGTRPCRLVGYPAVTLLLHGRPIGQPSQPSSAADSARDLAPGEVAESLLHDFSSCQAPLSDSVRVVVPGSTISAVRPAQLRACTVRVDRLGAPD